MKSSKQLIQITLKNSLFLLLGMLLFVCVIPVLSTYNVVLVGKIVDTLATVETIQSILFLLFLTLIVNVSLNVLEHLKDYLENILSMKSQKNLEKHLLDKLHFNSITPLERPLYRNDAFFLKNSFAAISQVVSHTFGIVQQCIMFVMYGFILFAYHWSLLPIVVLFSLPTIVYQYRLVRRREKHELSLVELDRESDMLYDMSTGPEAQKDMLVYSMKSFMANKWFNKSMNALQSKIGFYRKATIGETLTSSFVPLGFFLIQLVLVYLLIHHAITIGDYVAVTVAIGVIEGALLSSSIYLAGFQEFKVIKKRFNTFLSNYNPKDDIRKEEQKPRLHEQLTYIWAKELSFHYPDFPNHIVLKKINLGIKLGENLVIVGENGSGKSTLGKALLGLHSIGEDMLYFNHKDVSTINKNSVFKNMSVVNQDFLQYPFNVYENIAVSSIDEDEKRKIEAFIAKFPYLIAEDLHGQCETVLGNEFYGSKQLSGGQWQRITIARALYHERPFLLLDEATSALDPEIEAKLLKDIFAYRNGLTTILVTHRLGIASLADRIIVLDNGRIIEDGSHEQLLKREGKYCDMVHSQIDWVKEGDEQSDNQFSGII
ncbi:ABC transporter ATP-binding protein [Salipaludibacillus agaradhaerens]|uniref:ATP-binding cassette domain-containing protein n=1 Tax=Salipaludibacillus agaradhaerens TaxID=76935 RepID=UPI0021508BAE|nr:ABC transporter ATP-binding protein [Salipaludibacillus agaradhaerens]MCR6107687.1 ABC transporter ATP-binding protein [Salipaludibacillus agaradhaerens]MCR6119716.1 ABC transporter ATP-binding protein [Salipaludibacillus agaradhaerens]UJW58725.1 ABC transporter ATP-binding protein [Bacillus sp. A116_S68]